VYLQIQSINHSFIYFPHVHLVPNVSTEIIIFHTYICPSTCHIHSEIKTKNSQVGNHNIQTWQRNQPQTASDNSHSCIKLMKPKTTWAENYVKDYERQTLDHQNIFLASIDLATINAKYLDPFPQGFYLQLASAKCWRKHPHKLLWC